MKLVKHVGNAHADHPERADQLVACPLAECPQTHHLRYTALGRQHARRALRRMPSPAVAGLDMYEQIAHAPTLRVARRLAADLWRRENVEDL